MYGTCALFSDVITSKQNDINKCKGESTTETRYRISFSLNSLYVTPDLSYHFQIKLKDKAILIKVSNEESEHTLSSKGWG